MHARMTWHEHGMRARTHTQVDACPGSGSFWMHVYELATLLGFWASHHPAVNRNPVLRNLQKGQTMLLGLWGVYETGVVAAWCRPLLRSNLFASILFNPMILFKKVAKQGKQI